MMGTQFQTMDAHLLAKLNHLVETQSLTQMKNVTMGILKMMMGVIQTVLLSKTQTFNVFQRVTFQMNL